MAKIGVFNRVFLSLSLLSLLSLPLSLSLSLALSLSLSLPSVCISSKSEGKVARQGTSDLVSASAREVTFRCIFLARWSQGAFTLLSFYQKSGISEFENKKKSSIIHAVIAGIFVVPVLLLDVRGSSRRLRSGNPHVEARNVGLRKERLPDPLSQNRRRWTL